MPFELIDSEKFENLLHQLSRLEERIDEISRSLIFKKESSGEKLIQAFEAAQLLNISISTLHSYKKQGIIPFHRIGRRIYFRENEIIHSLKKIN